MPQLQVDGSPSRSLISRMPTRLIFATRTPRAALVAMALSAAALPAFAQAVIDPQLAAGSQPLAHKRVLFIFPDLETVGVVGDPGQTIRSVAPLSVRQKFGILAGQTLDPAFPVIAAAVAGVEQGADRSPHYGQGAGAYAERFGAASANIATVDLLSQAVLPTLFKQDPRYFRKGTGTAGARMKYAISRIVITQSDRGTPMFNYSEIGALAGSTALSNAYYPERDRTASNAASRLAVSLAVAGGLNLLREFRHIGH